MELSEQAKSERERERSAEFAKLDASYRLLKSICICLCHCLCCATASATATATADSGVLRTAFARRVEYLMIPFVYWIAVKTFGTDGNPVRLSSILPRWPQPLATHVSVRVAVHDADADADANVDSMSVMEQAERRGVAPEKWNSFCQYSVNRQMFAVPSGPAPGGAGGRQAGRQRGVG